MAHLNVRAWKPLNLQEYKHAHPPERVAAFAIPDLPPEPLYVLRMLVGTQNQPKILLPFKLKFLSGFIDLCANYQRKYVKVKHPFTYLTVRHGPVVSKTDDDWHVDGFSLKYNHLPEQSYVWADHSPTQFGAAELDLKGFDPAKHNLHKLIQKQGVSPVFNIDGGTIYCIDPYVIHRRPPNLDKKDWRSFVRVTFSPIEIRDVNNTINPYIKSNNDFDGVKQVRDLLI